MKESSRRAFGAVLSGLLAASMFAAIPASVPAEEATVQDSVLPAEFDLREQGVVTPVKMQNPWSTCWAFAGTSAAESSIMSTLKERGQTVNPKTFDLSEKHLAWFGSNPITKAIDADHAGEGMYVTNSEDVPNITWDNGAYGVNVATLYASGAGPTYEKYFPYQGKEGMTEKQYLVAHPDKGKAVARETVEAQIGMTMEEALNNKTNEKVASLLSSLRTKGYLTVPDDQLTVDAFLDASYQMYVAELAEHTCYTSLDDWSIPETTTIEGEESLSRNVSSGFTLVDGNKLPALSTRDAEGKWTGINQQGVDAVKSELMRGRGVMVAFKADMAAPGQKSDTPMMNEETWAHYTYDDVKTNHAVCIVGWNDDYSADNFLAEHKPPQKGAWLVKNSWGSEYDSTDLGDGNTINYDKWGITDESGKHTGYFWLSYYDKSAANAESFAFDDDLSRADGDLLVQMYDYMPSTVDNWNEEATFEQSEDVLKTANVFTNDTDSTAKMASVSTKTARTDATVKYSIYKLSDGFKNPEDGTLLGTKTATYEYAGLHREKLDGSIVIKPGEKFAVVAEETVESEGTTLHEFATNATYSKAHAQAVKAQEATAGTPADKRDRIADEYGVAVVNEGESFVYAEGAWTDWTKFAPRTALLNDYSIDNFSIKAYLVTQDEPEPAPTPAGSDMFRLYNPYSGEHFYTASAYERDVLVGLGWQDEGVGWTAPEEGAPVYRLYNPYAGDHHYTVSAFERDHLVELGWTDEGVGWYSAGEDGVPVYRQYNPYARTGAHNYTTSEYEAKVIVELGWLYEGIGWHGL